MIRLEKSKAILIREIHEEGRKILKRMDELKLPDIPLVCSEPNNYKMKEYDETREE